MSDWVTVGVEEQDKGGHLAHGAGLSRSAAHAQSVLNLNHTQDNIQNGRQKHTHTHEPTAASVRLEGHCGTRQEATPALCCCLPGRWAWTWPSVRSDRRAWSRPDWGSHTRPTAAWRATPEEKDSRHSDLLTVVVNRSHRRWPSDRGGGTMRSWKCLVSTLVWWQFLTDPDLWALYEWKRK